MLTVLLGFGLWQASAQQIVEIPGNGGMATNSYLPTYTYYNYSFTQQLYTPEEIGMPGTISSIAFYNSGTERTRSCDIYMVNTDKQSFSGGSDWITASSDDLVFSGSVTFTSGAWTTITLTNAFMYDGVSNLALIVDDNTGSYESSMSCYVFDATSMAIRVYSDYTNYDPTAPNYSGTVLNVKNQIQLGITPGTISCHPVSNVTSSNITSTGALVSWNASEDATSYILQYKTSSQSWDDNNVVTIPTTDTSYTFTTELNPITNYNVRVASLCGGGDTSVWRSTSFMTACDALTATPYTTGFETYLPVQDGASSDFVNYVNCWTRLASSSNVMVYHMSSSTYSHAGSQGCLDFNWVNSGWTIAIMPAFDNSIAINNLMLDFWLDKTGNSGYFEVGVMTDPTDASTFEVVDTVQSTMIGNGASYYEYQTVSLASYQGNGQYIAFRVSGAQSCGYRFDDLTVMEIPSCASPVKNSLSASNIDGHNATISFEDEDETHNSWTLYYKMNTESENDWQPVTLSDTTYTLTGLVPETTYNVYVVTNCGGVPGDDATFTYNFTTSVACPAPTAVTASPVYINDATITWTSTATVFNIEYGETGFTQGSGTTETVYDNTVTLTNLNAATSYTVYVQADCSGDNDGLSQWSSVQFTTLPSCPAPTQVAANNITSNSADIVWTAGYQEGEWELRYGPENFNPDTSSVSEIVTGTALFQMQNLPADTRYDIYVRAICSGTDTSAWSARMTFKTQCEAATLPLTEDFESVSDWGTPTCWQKFESPSMSGWAAVRNENAYSGSKSLHVEGNYNATSYGFMRLPNIDVDDISTLQVKLMARKSYGSRELIVGIIPEFFSVDSIYVAGSFTDLTSDYTEKIVSFEDFPGTTGYIIIGTPAGIGSSTVFNVDDITVEVRPNCMYPTNFSVDSVGETAVVLSWTELGTSESWNIEYGPMGYTQGTGTTEVSDSTHYTVENLSESTAYDFYVQSDCGSIGSDWVGPLTVVTSQYIMGSTGSDTITTCGMAIYDAGGPNGNHGTYGSFTLVVNPATPGSGLQISGTGAMGSGATLTIYDGVGTSGATLANYSGSFNASVAAAGPMTLVFSSSYSNGAGFELIAQCTDCYPPSNVTLSNITMTGVTVNWSGAASEYAVYALNATDTVYATTTDTTYTFTTLTSSSTYKVYVRSLCGSDSSLLTPMVSFNTACDQITVTETTPWFENFEGYAGEGERPFVCWETPVTDATYHGPFVYCGHAQSCHSGSNSAELKGASNLLVLPDFSNDIHDLRLSFWATATSTSVGTLEIGVVTDILDPTSFEVVVANAGTPGPRGTQSGVSGNGNFFGPFDFNGVQATTGRIALRYTSGSASASWNLDDFTVSLAPGCPSPVKTSVQATNVDGHNATITFTDNDPSHNSWTVYYRESDADESDPWSQTTTSTTSATITNLYPETSYDVYVVTNCATPDLVEDATFTYTFTTAVACPAPQNISVAASTDEAIISWFGTADSYTVTCNGNTVTVTDTTTTITGLSPATNYTVSITADCGLEGTSTAGTASFMTACGVVTSFPYSEGFESGEMGCWTNENIVGGNSWSISSSYYNSGTHSVYMSYTANTSSRLISPIFDLTSLTNPMLSFYRRMHAYSGTVDTIGLYYRTSASDQWVRFAGFDQVTDGFAMDSVALPNPSATYQFAIVGYAMDGWGIYLDDILVYDASGSGPGPVTCDVPTNLTVTNITNNSAVATWTTGGTETAWNLQYKAAVSADWGTTIPCTQPTYTFTDLAAGTQYMFRVQADCGAGSVSAWSDATSFTTTGGQTVTDPTVATNAASAIEQTTATLNATITNPDGVTITSKGFQWKATQGGTYTTVNGTGTGNDFTAALSNLTPGTEYRFKAFITFNGQTVEGSEMTFTTQPEDVEPCDVPTGLQTTDLQNESISITWDANPNVTSWNIQYKPVGGQLSSASSNTNNYTITGLTMDTQYEIQVQAVCANGTSDWCTAILAQTTNVGIESWLSNSVSLYPNPAREYVDIRVDGDLNVKMMEVYDVYGKLINTVGVCDTPVQARINVSGLANGMYFVRVTTDEGVVTKQFVKR